MAYGSALLKELETALSSVDLSDALTMAIESTRRGEADDTRKTMPELKRSYLL